MGHKIDCCRTFPSFNGLLTFYLTSFSHACKERNLGCYLFKEHIKTSNLISHSSYEKAEGPPRIHLSDLPKVRELLHGRPGKN